MNSSSDFRPTATWPVLQRRAEMLRELRAFFDQRGFLEVETPLISADVVVDRHLDPLSLTLFHDPRQPAVGPRRFLQTSPEFAMKRLLSSGATAIYQVTKAFRGGEVGQLHNPEFTMVEWYRVGDDYQAAMDLLAELTMSMLNVPQVERLTYRQAFQKHLQLDPLTAPISDLRQSASRLTAGPPTFDDDDRDGWLEYLLALAIEPTLGGGNCPAILYDYPASQAALSRVRRDDVEIAERFELYVAGIELANGYHELTDPETLRMRNRTNNEARQRDGKPALPESSRLLAAMDAGLPSCSGVALGFDRLVMAAVGAKSLAEVIAFPTDRA